MEIEFHFANVTAEPSNTWISMVRSLCGAILPMCAGAVKSCIPGSAAQEL